MRARPNSKKAHAARQLVGLPERLGRGTRSAKLSAPLAEVAQALEISELPHRDILRSNRWFAGGTLLKWLCQGLEALSPEWAASQGDYDIYFPSLDAFNDSARELLDGGFLFRCFRTTRTICQLCGRPGRLVDMQAIDELSWPLPRIHCQHCGEFGGVDAARLTADRLPRVTPEFVEVNQMNCLEMLSPSGDIFQLTTVAVVPTPRDVVLASDLSVCQFAADDQDLHFSSHAWTDLLSGRLRLVEDVAGYVNYRRFNKYVGRGFRPYAESVARIYMHRLHRAGQALRGKATWKSV